MTSLCWKSWKTTNSYCRVCSPSSTVSHQATLDGPPSRTPSPTLEELHSAMNSQLKQMDMSPMDGPPPDSSLTPVSTGKSFDHCVIDRDSEGIPQSLTTAPFTTAATGVESNTKSPKILHHAARTISKVHNLLGLSSKKSSSSRSKGAKTSAFSRYLHRIPKVLTFSQGIALMCAPKADSRASPDDSVTFTPVNESDTGLNPSGNHTSPDDEAPSDVQTSRRRHGSVWCTDQSQ